MERVKVGIIEPDNVDTDLMYRVMRSRDLEMRTMTGIMESEGVRQTMGLRFQTSVEGVEAVARDPGIGIAFGTAGAAAHMKHIPILREAGRVVFDTTLAAVGPFMVPCVNLDHLQELNTDSYSMVTCGGQATIPIAYAINQAADSEYTGIAVCISSKNAGPGTRANIDGFIQTTSKALHVVGEADRSKAIIVPNLAEPPLTMSNAIYSIVKNPDERAIVESVNQVVKEVQAYVPDYSLRVPPIVDGSEVTMIMQMEGTEDSLPRYSGNLDIINAAAVAAAEKMAARMRKEGK